MAIVFNSLCITSKNAVQWLNQFTNKDKAGSRLKGRNWPFTSSTYYDFSWFHSLKSEMGIHSKQFLIHFPRSTKLSTFLRPQVTKKKLLKKSICATYFDTIIWYLKHNDSKLQPQKLSSPVSMWVWASWLICLCVYTHLCVHTCLDSYICMNMNADVCPYKRACCWLVA